MHSWTSEYRANLQFLDYVQMIMRCRGATVELLESADSAAVDAVRTGSEVPVARRRAAITRSPSMQQTGDMTAIDFASFVDQLASVSGETILPFFRTALAIENKQGRRLRSGHRGRPRRRDTPCARSSARTFPATASSARNTAPSAPMPNMSGCSIRSTAPSPSSPAWWPGAR